MTPTVEPAGVSEERLAEIVGDAKASVAYLSDPGNWDRTVLDKEDNDSLLFAQDQLRAFEELLATRQQLAEMRRGLQDIAEIDHGHYRNGSPYEKGYGAALHFASMIAKRVINDAALAPTSQPDAIEWRTVGDRTTMTPKWQLPNGRLTCVPQPSRGSDEPDCPGEDCRMCNGEACNKCGAGCWNNAVTDCEHDGAERHEEPDCAQPSRGDRSFSVDSGKTWKDAGGETERGKLDERDVAADVHDLMCTCEECVPDCAQPERQAT